MLYIAMEYFVELIYFLTALLFILGLKRMSSPNTARSGVIWAGVAMVAATLATFLLPNMHNQLLMLVAIVIGTVVAWIAAKRVQMTDMPQMVGPLRRWSFCAESLARPRGSSCWLFWVR